VAEAGDGREALELIRKHLPNLVLLDITIPELNGLEALARAKKEFPAVQMMILSMHANEEYVLQALRAGARGYLLKEASVDELDVALRTVTGGEIYLSPRISKHVIANYLERLGNERPLRDELTPRQREIVGWFPWKGYPRLSISCCVERAARSPCGGHACSAVSSAR
jgi:DNA-binding NarL/FixJ family response regulator